MSRSLEGIIPRSVPTWKGRVRTKNNARAQYDTMLDTPNDASPRYIHANRMKLRLVYFFEPLPGRSGVNNTALPPGHRGNVVRLVHIRPVQYLQ